MNAGVGCYQNNAVFVLTARPSQRLQLKSQTKLQNFVLKVWKTQC